MSNDSERSEPRRRGSWGRKLLYVFAVLVALLAVTYFYVTSTAFLKGFILPKAGAAMNAQVDVASSSISPFSKVQLDKLSVKPLNSEPVITADEVRVRYDLFKILGGNIKVDELTLVNPVIQIIKQPDGSSNLDPLLKGGSGSAKSSSASSGGKKTEIHLSNIALQNATIRYSEKNKDGSSKLVELQKVNITLDQLGNALSGTLKISADMVVSQSEKGTNSALAASIQGAYAVALDQNLLPQTIKGDLNLDVSKGDGLYKGLAGMRTALSADTTMTEIRQLAASVALNGQNLGKLSVSGPLDLNKKEGHLKVQITSIDRNLLDLAASGKGIGFGQSQFNATNEIGILQGGSVITTVGSIGGRQVSITQKNQTTPALDLFFKYDAKIDLASQTVVLQQLALNGDYQNKALVRSSLDHPMSLSWGAGIQGFQEASLNLILTNFNFTDWRPLTPTNISGGTLNLLLALQASDGGKNLNLDLSAKGAGLNLDLETNHIQNAQLDLNAKGSVKQFSSIDLSTFNLQLNHGQEKIIQAQGQLAYDLKSSDASGKIDSSIQLPALLAFYPVAGVASSSGDLKLSSNFKQSGAAKAVDGKLDLAGFAGSYARYQFKGFKSSIEWKLAQDGSVLGIDHFSISAGQDASAGGTIELSGKYDLEKKTLQASFKTTELNENALRPFLASSLGDNQLKSIVLNSSGAINNDPSKDSSIKADLKITNWVVQDKAGKLPKTPLAVSLSMDGSIKNQSIDLRQFVLQLTPTDRAQNKLSLVAKLDMAPTNAAPSTLSLSSESMDLTTYYNLFAGSPATNSTVAVTGSKDKAPSAPAAQSSTAQTEPAPIDLPIKNLTADLKIDRFFLRDISISNWTATVAIRTNVIGIKPFKLALNGAPVDFTGNFNVGVPGYEYQITFSADHAPLEPLANSFGDPKNAGTFKGNLVAQVSITGAGVTGTNLQKSLQGTAFVSSTNMYYQVLGPRMAQVLDPISFVLQAPELTNTPINFITVNTEIGKGQVDLKNLQVQSEAFLAESHGPIQLAAILTNSTLNLPIDLSLRRSIAEKSKVLPANTPADAKYAKLPGFVTIKGTAGNPKTEINKLALANLGLQSVLNSGLGGKDLQKVSGILGSLSNSSGTNNAATNSTGDKLLNGLGAFLSKGQATNTPAGTNSPATNQPPQKTKINALDLLKGFQKN